jgi:hypothetical protein
MGPECDSPDKVLQLYLADRPRLLELVADAPVITDDRPYTEFPLWRAVFRPPGYREDLDGPRLRRLLGGR